jgi:hypothetical protein
MHDLYFLLVCPGGMALMVAVGAFRRLLVPGFAYVLVTNGCGEAEFPRTSE